MNLQNTRIGILGAGAMGRALAVGLSGAGVDPKNISLCDKITSLSERVASELGVGIAETCDQLTERSDTVLIAVKPGDIATALRNVSTTEPLWISIAAGVPISKLQLFISENARIIRAMPNTPALIGEGVTAFTAGGKATEHDTKMAAAIFSSIGTVWEAPTETLLDAVTGLSGSGPAYIFVLIEALADAGVREGLPNQAAHLLATQTVVGAGMLARESEKSPVALKEQVSSPGGTTVAGLAALEAAGFRSAVHKAVRAATARSKELGE